MSGPIVTDGDVRLLLLRLRDREPRGAVKLARRPTDYSRIVEKFLAIDFETAARHRASACAIGWAKFEAGQLVESGHELINPQLPDEEWDQFVVSIHGIEPQTVRDEPPFAEVWRLIEPKLAACPLVAHSASFDVSVLRAELDRANLTLDPFRYACSARLSRLAWPEMLSVTLPIMTSTLGIALDHHEAHSDAVASGLVLTAAVEQLGASTLGEALEKLDYHWGEVRSPLTWRSFGINCKAPPSKPDPSPRAQAIPPGPVPRRVPRAQRPPIGPLRASEMHATTDAHDETHPLFKRVVAFTGKLKSMTRREAFQLVLDVGGQPADRVTNDTNLLVCGEQDIRQLAKGATMSCKLQKATALRRTGLDVELVGELDFLRIL